MKTCTHCGKEKPLEQMRSFWSKKQEKRYYQSMCKECDLQIKRSPENRARENARKREKYAADPLYRENVRRINLKHRYGVPEEELLEILVNQGGGCGICGGLTDGPQGWHVDHDHSCCPGTRSCGACIRGILCSRCNLAIGLFKDNPQALRRAWEYLTARSVPA